MERKHTGGVLAAIAAVGALILICKRKKAAKPPGDEKRKRGGEGGSEDGGVGKRARKEPATNGAKGSVTDVSALMKAKTAIPESDQSNPEKLGKHYAKMAFKFESDGLDLSAVRDSGKYFSVEGNKVEPLEYAKFETPLARGAVRLGVFRLRKEDADGLAGEVRNASKAIASKFPVGSLVHFNNPEHYHITVQMVSHPSNPRPDAFAPGGGLEGQYPSIIPAPSPSHLHKETSLYKSIAAADSSPELKVHSMIFANSGTLLLLFTESSGKVQRLRQDLAKAMPGAVEKQPSILHITLCRMLRCGASGEQMTAEQRERVVQACAEWTSILRGRSFTPSSLWHVQENVFTYVDANSSLECPFKASHL